MSKLHPTLIPSLRLVPGDAPVILLMRHSVREELDNPMVNFTVPLTPEGIEMARDWGGELAGRIGAAYSSHAPRCLDTARLIVEGAGQTLGVEIAEKLCEPGCFVTDIRMAGSAFARLGAIEFVNHILGDQEVPGTLSSAEGTTALLRWLQERQPGSKRINLFITHDTILSTFIYHLTGKSPLTEADWPWMLEGTFLWFDAGRIRWVWRGVPGEALQSDYGLG